METTNFKTTTNCHFTKGLRFESIVIKNLITLIGVGINLKIFIFGGDMICETQDDFYSCALERLKKNEREAVLAIRSSLHGCTVEEIQKLETEILKQYDQQDKYQVYQFFLINEKETFEKILQNAESASDKVSFLSAPNRTDISTYRASKSQDRLSYLFGQFVQVEIKQTTDDGSGGVQTSYTREDYFLIYKAEILKFNNKVVAVLSFPRIRKHPHSVYDYSVELTYFQGWIADNLKVGYSPLDLKAFYESLQAKDYDKTGFYATDVKKGDNEYIAAGFRFQLPFKSDAKSTELFNLLDSIITPEFKAIFLSSFSEYGEEKGLTLDAAAIGHLDDFIDNFGLSEEFFNLLHQACEHGIGHLRYIQKGKTIYRYSLEYLQTRYGLVRVSHEGWGAIEPLYSKITEYIQNS